MYNYYDEVQDKTYKRARDISEQLPQYCRNFFYAKSNSTSANTLLSYMRDYMVLFRYIKEKNPIYKNMEIKDIDISCLEHLTPMDFDEYFSFVSNYEVEIDEGTDPLKRTNGNTGKARKLASLRSLYGYLNKTSAISQNPVALVDAPKLPEKPIRHLSDEERNLLLSSMMNKTNFASGKEKQCYEKTIKRDICIIYILLGTGMRVSELVGLDIADVDFGLNKLNIIRKGGGYDYVYFNDEILSVLADYLSNCRDKLLYIGGKKPDETKEDINAPLFISSKRSRMTPRSVEYMVAKYCKEALGTKNGVTPHKLRSTFGSELYKETGDIRLVADTLGHKSVNTTRKHYAAMTDASKKRAASLPINRSEL